MKIGRYTIIDNNQKIHSTVTIGNFCHITDVEIGENTRLMDYVKLMPGTKIGKNCKLDDYVNTSGYCLIGDNVKIKRCSMISQAVELEGNVMVMSHVTFVRVKRPHGNNKEEWVRVKTGAKIGSHSCIMAGVTIGKHAVVGMGAVVVKDCEPFGIYVGNPAKKIGEINA